MQTVVVTAPESKISSRMCSRYVADGTVVTWGDQHFGGDSCRVQDVLSYL